MQTARFVCAPFPVKAVVWKEDVDLESESAFEAWGAPIPPVKEGDVYVWQSIHRFNKETIKRQQGEINELADCYARLLKAHTAALRIVDAAEDCRQVWPGPAGHYSGPRQHLIEAVEAHAAAARGEAPKPVCANCNNANLSGDMRLRYMVKHPEVSTGFLCDQCHDADYRAKHPHGEKGTGPCPTGEKGAEGEAGKPDELREAYEKLGRATASRFRCNTHLAREAEQREWECVQEMTAKRSDPKAEAPKCADCGTGTASLAHGLPGTDGREYLCDACFRTRARIARHWPSKREE